MSSAVAPEEAQFRSTIPPAVPSARDNPSNARHRLHSVSFVEQPTPSASSAPGGPGGGIGGGGGGFQDDLYFTPNSRTGGDGAAGGGSSNSYIQQLVIEPIVLCLDYRPKRIHFDRYVRLRDPLLLLDTALFFAVLPSCRIAWFIPLTHFAPHTLAQDGRQRWRRPAGCRAAADQPLPRGERRDPVSLGRDRRLRRMVSFLPIFLHTQRDRRRPERHQSDIIQPVHRLITDACIHPGLTRLTNSLYFDSKIDSHIDSHIDTLFLSPPTCRRDVVGAALLEAWSPSLLTQWQNYLAGIQPIRSAVNIGAGVKDFVVMPVSM